jgi:hypothetical protein
VPVRQTYFTWNTLACACMKLILIKIMVSSQPIHQNCLIKNGYPMLKLKGCNYADRITQLPFILLAYIPFEISFHIERNLFIFLFHF